MHYSRHYCDRMITRLRVDPLRVDAVTQQLMGQAVTVPYTDAAKKISRLTHQKNNNYFLTRLQNNSHPIVIISRDNTLITVLTDDIAKYYPKM